MSDRGTPGQTCPAPSPRTPLAWGGALLLLGTMLAGLVGSAILLWQTIDVDALFRSDEPTPRPAAYVAPIALPALPESPAWDVYLYDSPSTGRFFVQADYYPALLGHWTSILEGLGARVHRIERAGQIDSLPPAATLVAPASVCLDDRERDALTGHLGAGGHLLATWALGARDGRCEWSGYDFLQQMTEAEEVGTTQGRTAAHVTVPGGLPLAVGLPPGTRLQVKTEPWIGLSGEAPYAFWSDWAMNPWPSTPSATADAAALTRVTPSGGRLAWFGFRIDLAASERDRPLVRRLVENATLWTAGVPLLETESWPDGHRAALALTQDVESGFRSSRRLARRARDLDVPVTFYVVSQLALEHPDLVESLRDAGAIASHTVDHRQLAGQSYVRQTESLRRSIRDLRAWSGMSPTGLRPPGELFDSLTLEAWARLGGRHLAATNDARTAAPEVYSTTSGPMILLPRVVDDDYAVMVLRGQRSPDSLFSALNQGLRKTRLLGGLHLITLHTQLIGARRYVDTVMAVGRSARAADDVWIAGASEIAEWWRGRAAIVTRSGLREDGSVRISLWHGDDQPLVGAWLRLYLPGRPGTYAAPESEGGPLPSRYAPGGIRIALPDLAPGEALEILVPRRAPQATDREAAARDPLASSG